MAIAISNTDATVFGDRKVLFATVTFDSSYPTGGEAIAATDFGGQLEQIDFIIPGAPSLDDEAINGVIWDRTNSKLLVVDAAGAQEGNTTDLSSTTVEIMVVGK